MTRYSRARLNGNGGAAGNAVLRVVVAHPRGRIVALDLRKADTSRRIAVDRATRIA